MLPMPPVMGANRPITERTAISMGARHTDTPMRRITGGTFR